MGRAAQQLGIPHVAVTYYRRALGESRPGMERDDLSREIAYNLMLIYRASGAAPLAANLARMHLTV